MTVLTTEAIDDELSTRSREVTAMSTTLVELDAHPGLAHVRLYPPTGGTAERWTFVEEAIAALWEDLGRITSIVDSARAVRSRRAKLTDADRGELTRLLRERPMEVSRQRIPLAQRVITGDDESIEYVGIAEMVERMRSGYPVVVGFLDAIDQVNSLMAQRLVPVYDRLEEAAIAPPAELAGLLAISASDPLSLAPRDIEDRVRVIAEAIDRRASELAALAEVTANWEGSVAHAGRELDALADSTTHAAQTRARAEHMVMAGPLPAHADAESELRSELEALRPADAAGLRALQLRISAAQRIADEAVALAQGLLDRRNELKGRLEIYQSKAARLGLGEDADLLASARIADGLLWRRPCDLRAVTRAVADYQQVLTQKRGTAG